MHMGVAGLATVKQAHSVEWGCLPGWSSGWVDVHMVSASQLPVWQAHRVQGCHLDGYQALLLGPGIADKMAMHRAHWRG